MPFDKELVGEFSDEEWERISVELDGDKELNSRLRDYLELTIEQCAGNQPSEVFSREINNAKKISTAIRKLISAFGWDKNAPEEDCLLYGELIDHLRWYDEIGPRELAAMAENSPPRLTNSVLLELCGFWEKSCNKKVAISTNASSGIPSGPLVRFLMTAGSVILNRQITAQQSKYAVDTYKRYAREAKDV